MSTANNSTKKYMDIVRSSDPLVRHAVSQKPAVSKKPAAKSTTSRVTYIPPKRPQLVPSSQPALKQPQPAKKSGLLNKISSKKSPAPAKSSVPVAKSPVKTGIVEHLGEVPRAKSAPVTPNFINTAEVEKRPLGTVSRPSILDEKLDSYNPATDPRRSRAVDPVRKASTKKKTSIPLPVVVLITIILGIASGIGVYFLLSH